MKLRKNNNDTDGPREFVTKDLPIKTTDLAFYTRSWGDRVIIKFQKEQPQIYLGVKTLLRDLSFRLAKTLIVREAGTGYLPVLCARAMPSLHVRVSIWNADSALLERNVAENYVDRRVDIAVENAISGSADVCVLVQADFQSQSVMASEIAQLMNCSTKSVVFLISHVKKGSELLSEKIAAELGLSCQIVGRGFGGARVFKFTQVSKIQLALTGLIAAVTEEVAYTYQVAGTSVSIRTGGSLFSKSNIDAGTDLLIQHAVAMFSDRSSKFRLYDMGCGSGVIAVSMLAVYPYATAVLSDIDARAVAVAKTNIVQVGGERRARVVLSDGPEGITGEFNLIMSNPPLHISRNRLMELITHARKRLIKHGTMFLVVARYRVSEIRELLQERGIYAKVVVDSGLYSILYITK